MRPGGIVPLEELESGLLHNQVQDAEMAEDQPEEDPEADEKRKRLLFYHSVFPEDVSVTPSDKARKILELSPEELDICVAQAEAWLGKKIETHTIQKYIYSLAKMAVDSDAVALNMANDSLLVGTTKQLMAMNIAGMNPYVRFLSLIGFHFVSNIVGDISQQEKRFIDFDDEQTRNEKIKRVKL
jgi:hypothetical protein